MLQRRSLRTRVALAVLLGGVVACSGSSTPEIGGSPDGGTSSGSSSSSSSGSSGSSGGDAASSSGGGDAAAADSVTPGDAGDDGGYLSLSLPISVAALDPRVQHACGAPNTMDGDFSVCDSTPCIVAALPLELPAGSYSFSSPNVFASGQNRAALLLLDGPTGSELQRVDVAKGNLSFVLAKTSRVRVAVEGHRLDPSACVAVKTLLVE